MPASRGRPRSVTVGVAGGVTVLAAVVAFQVALVAGAPWGRVAWGGGNDGALPAGLRVGSAVSAVVLTALAVLLVVGPGTPRRRLLLRVAGGLFVVGTGLNAVSPSPWERVWAPVAAVLAAVFLLRAGPVSAGRRRPTGPPSAAPR